MTYTYTDIMTQLSEESYDPYNPGMRDCTETEMAVASILETPEIRETIETAAESVSERAADFIGELLGAELLEETVEKAAKEEVCVREEIEDLVSM